MKGRFGVHPFALLIILLLTASSLLVSRQNARCVALITEMRGDVFVRAARATEFKRATWGTQLYGGDVVKTSGNGTASLLMSNNNLIELGSGSSITISEGRSAPQGKSKTISGISSEPLTNLSGLTMRSTGEGEVVALAGLRSIGTELSIEQLSPLRSKIRTLRPTFTWQSNVPTDKFKVELFDRIGLLWARESNQTRLEYPEGEKPLSRGETYFWKVKGIGLTESYESARAGFSVIAERNLAMVQRQEQNLKDAFSDDLTGSSYDFFAGTLYQQHGLLEESIAKFEAVAQRHPDAPTVYEVLGKLYKDVGLKDKSIAALQKALKLSQGR